MDAHEEYQKSIAKAFIDRQMLLDAAKAALRAEFGDLDAANIAPGTYWAQLAAAIAEAEKGS